jgi:hypothetical protein
MALDLGTVEGLENVAIPLPSAGGVNKDAKKGDATLCLSI